MGTLFLRYQDMLLDVGGGLTTLPHKYHM